MEERLCLIFIIAGYAVKIQIGVDWACLHHNRQAHRLALVVERQVKFIPDIVAAIIHKQRYKVVFFSQQ